MKRVSVPCGPGLDAGDDALHTVPASRSVIKLLEPAELLAVSMGSGPRRGGLLQLENMLAQRRGGRHPQSVIEPPGTAEA
jgi:hypothetical protein